ncbi:MAG: hypothetical protein V1744_06955 [Candidatus Altiarchaeota archaeon]
MKPRSCVLLLILLLPLSSAQETTVLNIAQPKHLGDENITEWELGWMTEGTSLEREFYAECPYDRAWIDMMVIGAFFNDDLVIVNNKTVGSICQSERWVPCNITLPPGVVKVGDKNSLRFESRWHLMTYDFDDYMFKKMKLKIDYVNVEPHITVSKSQSAYELRLGDALNVSVMLTNIGCRPAFNLSAHDVRLTSTYVVSGSTGDFFSPLRGGDVLRYQYTLVPSETGLFTSQPGWFEYYDSNWTKHNGTIEPTVLTVKPPKPQLYAYKRISAETIPVNLPADVEITVANNGSEPAYNLIVEDSVPENFSVTSGSPNLTLDYLAGGQNVTLRYTLAPGGVSLYSSSAVLRYKDKDGFDYERTSNPVNITAVKSSVPTALSNRTVVFSIIAVVVVVLLAAYWVMRGSHAK